MYGQKGGWQVAIVPNISLDTFGAHPIACINDQVISKACFF